MADRYKVMVYRTAAFSRPMTLSDRKPKFQDHAII